MWCHVKFTAGKCNTAIPTKFQQSTFYSGHKYKTSLYEYIPKAWESNWAFSVKIKRSSFLELNLADKMRMRDLARCTSKGIPLYL